MKLEGQVRIPSGCAIAAVISKEGKRMSGEMITNAMKPMHDRSNGLGGGFAAYGIYPEYKEFYALHMFFDSRTTRKDCEVFLKEYFEIVQSEIIPTRKIPEITDEPIIWRYFVAPLKSVLASMQLDEKEFVARIVMKINTELKGAYVFSSGKNMGTFKAVGYPEDVGKFYKLEKYEGYSWSAHGRYPTNTPGWWGGAHPFTLLDWSIVHNGEISSYDANRRFIEMFGYKCTLQTDTEVITYIMDYLVRVQGLTLEEAAILELPMLFYAFDEKEYMDSRDFYFDYSQFTPGPVVTDFEALCEESAAMLQNIVSANEQADLKKFRETFLNTVDGCSTERICRKIKTNYINI